jgi:hypothetical protein
MQHLAAQPELYSVIGRLHSLKFVYLVGSLSRTLPPIDEYGAHGWASPDNHSNMGHALLTAINYVVGVSALAIMHHQGAGIWCQPPTYSLITPLP